MTHWPWPALTTPPCVKQTTADLSPVDTAYAYFRAWNTGSRALMRSYEASGYQDCDDADVAPPKFETIACKVAYDNSTQPTEPADQAVVACSFTVAKSQPGFEPNPTGLWMRRAPGGPWLIIAYGVPIGP